MWTWGRGSGRIMDGEIAAKFLAAVLAQPRVKRLLSGQHFSVDGTLIEAWASMKSFKPRDRPDDPPTDDAGGGRNATVDFKGEKRTNETHRSTTDPEASSIARAPAWRRSSASSATLMENRSGLIVDARLTLVSGHA